MKQLITFLFTLVLLASTAWQMNTAVAETEVVTKTLVWPDGTRYVGGVVDGRRSGKGTIFWQDGTRFVGQFADDMRNGPGTMILPDGTVYTGFFRDDELVDTEATIASSNAAQEAIENAQSQQMDDADTREALGDTQLPMEADSISAPDTSLAQVDENDLLSPPAVDDVADETMVEPETVAAITEPPTAPAAEADTVAVAEDQPQDPFSQDVTEINDSVKQALIETIDLWAAAWADQNVVQYLSNYSDDFVIPGNQSRRTWEALRRTRINRPSYINLDVSYERFELVEPNIVDFFFRQSYRSNTYSDLTEKVLRMRKEDTDWKILIERSR